MHISEQETANNRTAALPSSHQILKRFSNPRDCLIAHLMLECSEVLGGVKPANLISIVNRTRPCGRNLYRLWQHHQAELADHLSTLQIMVLRNRPQALLLLCCNSEQLERHLAHSGIRSLLNRAGYAGNASCQDLVAELCSRIAVNDSFPHEIGLFIGYPAKDVAAFMGMVNLPFACQGLWKIYGNPMPSLELAEQYRCCRQRMAAVLTKGDRNSLDLGSSEHPFFCRSVDNDYQYPSGPGATKSPEVVHV